MLKRNFELELQSFFFVELAETDAPSTSSSSGAIKKVNSQVEIDEKTGKIVSTSTSTSTDCDLATNIDVNEKTMNEKIIKLQASSSLPDLVGQTSSPTSTSSSNSNNQISGHGTHVILAVESEDVLNEIDAGNGGNGDLDYQTAVKQKIKLNIDPNSSSSTSSNNLEYGHEIVSNTSTL